MNTQDKIKRSAMDKLARTIREQCDSLRLDGKITTFDQLQAHLDLSKSNLSKEEIEELGKSFQENLLNSENHLKQFCKDNDIDVSCWKSLDDKMAELDKNAHVKNIKKSINNDFMQSKALTAEELHEKGVSYYYGTGVKKDIAKAVECFEQAIAVGNLPQSKYMLGAILLSPSSINGCTERDADRGTELILEAASEGYPKAMVYVVNTFGTLSYRFVTLLHFFFQHKKFSMMRARIALANKCKKELSL